MAQYKNIDIVPDSTVNRIHLSQGDIGRTLIFYLFENALSWSVPASSTIKCQGTKPSGFGFSVSCTYSGNAVTCVTTDEMTDEFGQIEAELLITSSDESQVFGTSNFILDIEKNPHPACTEDGNAETAIALTARITALESAVGDVNDLETAADDLAGAINEIASGGSGGSGLTDDIKTALLQIASKVAYIDANGQDYYDALESALYPPKPATGITLNTNSLSFRTLNSTQQLTATLTPVDTSDTVSWASNNTSVATVSSSGLVTSVAYGYCTITAIAGNVSATCTVVISQAILTSISAVYMQSGTVYDTDMLDDLKSDLVVTANYDDLSTSVLSSSDYTLSGTLTTGTSTTTVTYEGKTDTFTVAVTETDYDLKYGLTDSDMSVTGNLSNNYNSLTTGYYVSGSTRISHTAFDLTLTKNRKYLVKQSANNVYGYTVYKYGDGTLTSVTNQTSITSTDTGLLTSDHVFFNNPLKTIEVVRITSGDGSSTVSLADFEAINIYESKALTECELDNSSWVSGYFKNTGEIASASQGEMYTALAIPVTAGHTYRFSNADSNWTSNGWAGWYFIQSDLTTKSSRKNVNTNVSYIDITIEEGYSYLMLAVRNMENYYTTATLTDVTV